MGITLLVFFSFYYGEVMSVTQNRKLGRCPVLTEESNSLLVLLYKITLLRCFIKWVIHLFTGTCELQRIAKNNNGGIRTIKIGKLGLVNTGSYEIST